MVDYADIGKRIRACRLAKGMTQEQLANEVGVVVTHISHIETGNSVPSLKTLIDIINASPKTVDAMSKLRQMNCCASRSKKQSRCLTAG